MTALLRGYVTTWRLAYENGGALSFRPNSARPFNGSAKFLLDHDYSIVVIPAARASPSRRAASARSTSSGAARVAAIVTLMPPASYGAPAIRAANSAARSPAKLRAREWRRAA